MEQTETSLKSNQSTKLGNVDAAATLLQVPKTWIYDRTRQGSIPMLKVGKYVRFDLDELLKWAKAGCPAQW